MLEFRSELLSVMIKMSGWYNIFFCVQDIPVSDEIIEKLIKVSLLELSKTAFQIKYIIKHFKISPSKKKIKLNL